MFLHLEVIGLNYLLKKMFASFEAVAEFCYIDIG